MCVCVRERQRIKSLFKKVALRFKTLKNERVWAVPGCRWTVSISKTLRLNMLPNAPNALQTLADEAGTLAEERAYLPT